MGTCVSETSWVLFFSRESKARLVSPVSVQEAALTSWPAGDIGNDEYTPITTHIRAEFESMNARGMMKNALRRHHGVKTAGIPSPTLMKNSWAFLLQPLPLARTLVKEACIIERPKPVPPL